MQRDDLRELTKKDLQARLRELDESVSGSKEELIDRLLDAGETETDGSQDHGGDAGSVADDGVAEGSWTDHLDAVRATVRQLTSFEVESFVGVAERDSGWSYSVQVVESRRVPASADVVSIFRVDITSGGRLEQFERTHRNRRDQVSAS